MPEPERVPEPKGALAAPRSTGRLLRWGGWLLLGLGLLGHLYAAHAMGGSRVAYAHHVLGFGLAA